MGRELNINLDLGGMSEAARSIIPGSWNVPAEVTLDESADLLCWSWTQESRRVQPTKRLLGDFLKIWRSGKSAIRRFAQLWGPLSLCEQHQLPVVHQRIDFAESAAAAARNETLSICQEKRLDDGRYAEPLGTWRRLSRQADLIIDAAKKAHWGELPFETYEQLLADILDLPKGFPPELTGPAYRLQRWNSALKWASPGRTNWFREAFELGLPVTTPEAYTESMVGRVRDAIGSEEQFRKTLQHRDAIAEKITQWIADGGGFYKTPVWRDDQPEWQEEVGSLYAAIGVGLWNVIGDMTTNPTCKHCGQVFEPTKITQLHYCHREECRRERIRANQRRSRANRAARAGLP